MEKKYFTYILLLFVFQLAAQSGLPEDQYNGFSSRSFMKFNGFLTVPTFSFLQRENQSVEIISRVSNIEFEDASKLHVLSYSGKITDNAGAGIAVFQQDVGVFKDLGGIANYTYQIEVGRESAITFGYNFFYSRRGIDESLVLTKQPDVLASNYQPRTVVVFQPAVTFSFTNFYAGVFLENIVDFNLKKSEMVTPFAEKTFSAHMGYMAKFDRMGGMFTDMSMNLMAVARRAKSDGFSFGGNAIVNLPLAGWLKAGYDNQYGFNAGVGVNLSERLSVGFAYEKKKTLGATNEFGLLYSFGGESTKRKRRKRRRVQVVLPAKRRNRRSVDNSEALKKAQDSINALNRKVDEVLRLLKGSKSSNPIIIRDTIRIQSGKKEEVQQNFEEKDTSIERSDKTPWRNQFNVSTGGAGTMYYVAVDQYKDKQKALNLVDTYERKDVKVRYVKHPQLDFYYIYIERFANKEDADKMVEEVNRAGKKGFEKDVTSDLGLKIKSVSKDRVYVVKITFGSEGETYKEPKSQPPARVIEADYEGVESAYYLRVFVNGDKRFADRNVDELRADNIKADYFLDKKTGFRHVYIFKTQDRDEAIRMYNNNLDGAYYDRKAIIFVK